MANIRRRRGRADAAYTKADHRKLLDGWIRAAALRDLGRGSTALRVACSLHYYAQRSESVSMFLREDAAVAYPGQARLARELAVTPGAVVDAIKTLERAELITTRRSAGASNVYQLLPQRHNLGRDTPPNERTAPNLRAENPCTDAAPNYLLRRGNEGARAEKRGAAPPLEGADAPQRARPAVEDKHPRRERHRETINKQPRRFQAVESTDDLGRRELMYRRLSDGKYFRHHEIADELAADRRVEDR